MNRIRIEDLPVDVELTDAEQQAVTGGWSSGEALDRQSGQTEVTIRVWDAKTDQTRQVTLIQDL